MIIQMIFSKSITTYLLQTTLTRSQPFLFQNQFRNEHLTNFDLKYILQLDQFIRQYIRKISYNPGGKFLILFINPNILSTNATQRTIARRLFEIMYDGHNAANVIFLYAIDAYEYNIYVTNPYRNLNECGSLQPIHLDFCRNGTLDNPGITKAWTLKPRIPKTLPNCTFKFCARVAEPYINEGCQDGLEMSIIKVLQEKLKFKVCCSITFSERIFLFSINSNSIFADRHFLHLYGSW